MIFRVRHVLAPFTDSRQKSPLPPRGRRGPCPFSLSCQIGLALLFVRRLEVPMRNAAVLLIVVFAGCGQKGPLTLPEKHPGDLVTRPTQTPGDAPNSANDVQKKKDESDEKP